MFKPREGRRGTMYQAIVGILAILVLGMLVACGGDSPQEAPPEQVSTTEGNASEMADSEIAPTPTLVSALRDNPEAAGWTPTETPTSRPTATPLPVDYIIANLPPCSSLRPSSLNSTIGRVCCVWVENGQTAVRKLFNTSPLLTEEERIQRCSISRSERHIQPTRAPYPTPYKHIREALPSCEDAIAAGWPTEFEDCCIDYELGDALRQRDWSVVSGGFYKERCGVDFLPTPTPWRTPSN